MPEYKSEPFIDVTRGGFWCRCSIGFSLEADLIEHLSAHGESPRSVHVIALQSALATTFVTLQRERNPTERQRLWAECLRLAGELEKLNGAD